MSKIESTASLIICGRTPSRDKAGFKLPFAGIDLKLPTKSQKDRKRFQALTRLINGVLDSRRRVPPLVRIFDCVYRVEYRFTKSTRSSCGTVAEDYHREDLSMTLSYVLKGNIPARAKMPDLSRRFKALNV